jgi:hypothetical protein
LITQNVISVDVNLKNLLDLWKKDILLNFNCHHIATIKEFTPGGAGQAPTVKATMNYKKTFIRQGANGQFNSYDVDYPIMLDMPVIILQGGGAALTFPIESGDTCLVMFNDRDIDNWFHSGQISSVSTQRLHSFADGIALVGVNSNAKPILNYDQMHALLTYGVAKVGVSETKALIANQLTTLGTVLTQLVTALSTLTTAMSSATPPTVVASIAVPSAAAAASLVNIQTLITGLLE